MLKASDRVAILLHDGVTGPKGKTGLSLLRYSELPIVAVIDQDSVGGDIPTLTGIQRNAPIVASVKDALAYKPDVLMIGIAPSGGLLPESWRQEIRQALIAGVSVVNGLHTAIANDPDLLAAKAPTAWIWDVRQEPQGLTVGSGQARSLACRRVLTVGTDMSIGKMSTGLELHRLTQERGLRSRFIATGQTGLMLGHEGIPLDAVRVDYAAGAVEQMVMRHGQVADVIYIEGQGSLMNPASTATLPLMRGSQPTHLILAHRAGQAEIQHFPEFIIPPLTKAIELYEMVATAGGTFSPAKVVAIALNTFRLSEEAALQAIEQAQRETGLPCTDAIRYGAAPLLDAILVTDFSQLIQ